VVTTEDNEEILAEHKDRMTELTDQRATLATFLHERVMAVERKAKRDQERDATLTPEEKTARRKEQQAEDLAAEKKKTEDRELKKKKKKLRAQRKEAQKE
jgi:hypothetical protein